MSAVWAGVSGVGSVDYRKAAGSFKFGLHRAITTLHMSGRLVSAVSPGFGGVGSVGSVSGVDYRKVAGSSKFGMHRAITTLHLSGRLVSRCRLRRLVSAVSAVSTTEKRQLALNSECTDQSPH